MSIGCVRSRGKRQEFYTSRFLGDAAQIIDTPASFPPFVHLQKPDSRAFATLLLGGAAIALSPILIRLADVGPVASAFWRSGLAAPLLILWAFWEREQRSGSTRDSDKAQSTAATIAPLIIAGLAFAGDLAFWHLSVTYTSVANATLLSNLAPVFVTLGAWLAFGQRISRQFFMAMLVAFTGVAMLVGPDFHGGGTSLWGDFLGVVTAMFYGAYMLAIKHARERWSTALVMAASTSITALALLPTAIAIGDTLIPSSASGWLVLVVLAVVPQVIGQSLIAYAMARLPVSLSSLSLLVQPLLASFYASLWLGEGITALQVVGGAVVLTGIAMARKAAAP